MNLPRPFAASLLATTFLSLCSAISALADTLSVTHIAAWKGMLSFTIPRLEIVDGNMTEADVRAAFSGDDIAAAAKLIAGWDAASMRIPELSHSQTVKPESGAEETVKSIYRDLTLTGLQDGVAQSSRLEGIEMEATGPEGFKASFGPATTGIFDVAGVVALYAGGGGEMKTLYKDFAVEGGKLQGPEGFGCDVGKMAFAEFKARPFQTSPFEIVAIAESFQGKKPSPEEEKAFLKTFLEMYADLLQGMEVSPGTFDGMSCSFADEQGNTGRFSFGKMDMEGFGKGRYGAVTLNNLDVAVEGQGFLKAGKLVFKGMDLNTMLETLKAAGPDLSDVWFEQNARKMVPSFDGFAIEAIDLDVPDETRPGERVKGSVGAFDLTLKAYRLGIPTDISITADKVAIDLPADTTDEQVAQIKALGYDRIEMSGATKLHWDEASQTIVIDEVSTSGADMGTFSISAVLGNAREELFAEDPQVMQMAAIGLSVKELTVSTKDEGLAEKVFTMVGTQQGQDPAAVRTQISGMAAGMVPMLLGGTEQAQQVANAVMTFLNGGSSLKITAVAKDAAGLGLVDFMAAQQNPAAIVEKVDISAEAQ
jgi:hypothetical protein